MPTVQTKPRLISWLLPLLAVLLLAGCALLGTDRPDHSFDFDAIRDSPDVEILDYEYGKSKNPVRPEEWHKKQGLIPQARSIGGSMLRGEYLYVKWMLKSTGQVYEERVDLRDRLPWNISHHTVFFVVDGSQLYVYLISQDRKPADWPVEVKSRLYRNDKAWLLYPDQRPASSQ